MHFGTDAIENGFYIHTPAALSDGTVQYLFGNGYGTVAFGQFLAGPVVTIGGALSSLEVNAFDVAAGAATPVVTQSDVSKIVSVQGACVGGTGLTLEVTSPNGGEALPLRSPVRIEWRRGALVLGVNVEVSRDDGVHWQRVASDLTGNEFTWSAPPPATTHGRVRVVDANLFTLSDQSNGSFSVQPTAAVPMDGGSRGPWFSTGYPNPMHRTVRFDLRLATAGDVTVEVFDVAGRRVGVVANGRLAAGEHSLVWDGRIGTARAGDGVFFVRARIDGTQFVRRIVRVE